MVVIHITDKNFISEVENTEVPVLIDAFSPMCGPCKALLPIVEALSNEFEGKVKFAKINTAVSREIARDLRVYSVPTLIFINKGKEIDRSIGYINKEQLRKNLFKLLEFLKPK